MKRLDELYQEAFGWSESQLACVHLALGCYLAPRWPAHQSPAWAVMVGPQSCGKSTILSMFDGIPYSVCVDHLTRNALTSCYADEDDPEADHSLFHKLSVNTHPVGEKVWIVQELSSILAMEPVVLEKHFADLRAAHVGKHVSHGGMSGTRVRNIGSFGMLIGTTEAFEPIRAKMTTFGDRFLAIRMARHADAFEDLRAESDRAWACDAAKQAKMKLLIREETHKIINRGIANLSSPVTGQDPPTISIPPALADRLSAWTTIHSTFATAPLHNGVLATAVGKPYRIVEQVRSWGDTHALLDERTEWNESEISVARRVFQDSMPRGHWDLLSALAQPGGAPTTNMNLIRQWAYLGAVETTDGSDIEWRRDQTYRLTEKYRQMAERTGYFDE